MAFDRRFAIGLIAWIAALLLALCGATATLLLPGLTATRLIAATLVAAAGFGLWRHVARTNRELAQFIEAIRFDDMTMRLDRRGGAGFDRLAIAIDAALGQRGARAALAAGEQRLLEALIDDIPVALLTVDADARVMLTNKMARRLFDQHHGMRAEDFHVYGATFARRLEDAAPPRQEILILTIAGRPQRALVRIASLARLGRPVQAVTIQPLQDMLDTVEVAAQTDLVRVLTHEILNSLTPVTSLAASAARLLAATDSDDPRIADARAAVTTLARRADGLSHFIASYRAIARPPELARSRFEAAPYVAEFARLFAADWPDILLDVAIDPPDLVIDADPDLLAQAIINLLRNAAEAAQASASEPRVSLEFGLTLDDRLSIEIVDNGGGVPVALRGDVFLPFFTTKSGGTGIGLNLVRQIIVAHGGTVGIVESGLLGARFRLVI